MVWLAGGEAWPRLLRGGIDYAYGMAELTGADHSRGCVCTKDSLQRCRALDWLAWHKSQRGYVMCGKLGVKSKL
jgi:hypothetical protein